MCIFHNAQIILANAYFACDDFSAAPSRSRVKGSFMTSAKRIEMLENAIAEMTSAARLLVHASNDSECCPSDLGNGAREIVKKGESVH